MTRGEPWTDEEIETIVDTYFTMLQLEFAGEPFVKAQVRRELQAGALVARSNGPIEFKMQNISAVLENYGRRWVEGYKPMHNYQAELERAVVQWLTARGVELPEKRVRDRG